MRIYISGPITGRADFIRLFDEAERELKREYGDKAKIVNPAYMSRTIDSFEHRDQIELCFKLLDQCDAIYLIDGWEASPGAQAEYGYSVANKLLVIEQKHFRTHVPTLITPEDIKREVKEMETRKKPEKKYKVVCEICGKEFMAASKRAAICSDECRKERNRRYLKAARTAQAAEKPKEKPKGIRPSRAFEIEAEARKVGKHYADIQKEKTLAMVRAQMEGK